MTPSPCGASGLPPRAPTATEAVILVVIVVAAALPAAAGLPTLSVVLLLTEALSLGVRLLRFLRGTSPGLTEA